MPHDPETIRQDVVEKSTYGGHDLTVLTKYEAPAADDGIGIADDPFKEKDIAVAHTMMRWLNKHFPGYPWACVSDLRQKIVSFNIPILMGVNSWYVINLTTHDIIDGLTKGAGEILERYRLPRHRFHLGAFLDAREQHSKLLVPTRKVPV